MVRECIAGGCSSTHYAKGYCVKHYHRIRKHGDLSTNLAVKHGQAGSRAYHSWGSMIQRCTNVSCREYPYYGGRGIAVCDRWRDFANFYEDMGDRPLGASLDRIDNDGNYEPGNCRWATQDVQLINQRLRSNNTSGFRGVSYASRRGDWTAEVKRNGVWFWVGRYSSAKEAAWMRDQWASVIHGDDVQLNFDYEEVA